MYEDDWVAEFKNRATPRLRAIFEAELSDLPPFVSNLLTRLRQAEED